jgi:CHAT domain-containing protein
MRIDGRLVVLSACASDGTSPQDLSVRFVDRGVREVISSRFVGLDDAAAFTFMARFYEELKLGANSGTALLRARSVMIDGSYPAYKHPYFWAAFQSFV